MKPPLNCWGSRNDSNSSVSLRLQLYPFTLTIRNRLTSGFPTASDNDPESAMRPKRRRRLAGSDDKLPKNQIFYFVDANSSSREKRAHVMRHHVQEKRRQRGISNATSDSDRESGQSVRYVPWQDQRAANGDRVNWSHENGIPSGSSSVVCSSLSGISN